MLSRSYIRSRSGSRNGIALVTVLAFIVLLTILIVSFISFTRLNRLSTNSYSRGIQAQEVAMGGMQDILSDLHNEIVAGSIKDLTGSTYTQSGTTIYVPATNQTAVPARIGYATASYGTDTTSATLPPTLIRVSRATGNPNASGGDSFFTQITANMGPYTNNIAAVPGQTILNRASQASTAATSVDGRSISAARWNKTCLLAGPTGTIPSPFTTAPPDWVYVTRTGSRVCSKTELPSLVYSNNVTKDYYQAAGTTPSPGTPPAVSPVVGRYAFVMYDESAVLDANVAGYPYDGSGASATTNVVSNPADPTTGMTQRTNGKSYLSYADLTQLPGFSGVSAAQSIIDGFVTWRNASAGTSGNSYLLALISYAKYGFLDFNIGDSPLLGRQDLINYFANLDSLHGTAYSKALPYLGTFSRAVSVPTWTPSINSSQDPNYVANLSASAPYNYKTNAETAGAVNRDLANVRFAPPTSPATIIHYPDDGTVPQATLQSSYSYTVNAGDPLLQTRFSLAKINWLSQADPVAGTAPTGNYPAAIQACFGLVWGAPGSTSTNSSTSTSTANGGNPCWNYVGSQAGSGATASSFNGTIETLDQVAKENREPNFFELLKAAILSGSLGLGGGPAAFANGTNIVLRAFAGSIVNAHYQFCLTSDRQGVGNVFSYTLGPVSTVAGPAQFPDVQIIQIGANIIDQYDSDSYPTAIYFPYGGSYTDPLTHKTYTGVWNTSSDPVKGGNAFFGPVSMVYGDENLPLLHRMFATIASPSRSGSDSPADNNDFATHNLEGWIQPELWNPHQVPNSIPTNTPVNFEIRAYGTAQTYNADGGNAQNNPQSLALPSNPPMGWTAPSPDPYAADQNTKYWLWSFSPLETYYDGSVSTEDPQSQTTSGGPKAGTLVFKVTDFTTAFTDTPRLLTVDTVPGVTVDTTYGLPNTSISSSVDMSTTETSYADTNFPDYSIPKSNGNGAYPNFLNHFAAFSTGVIKNQTAVYPYQPFYVGTIAGSGGVSFVAGGTSGAPGTSYALGWFPAGHPETFHPYSFISGIFETCGISLPCNMSGASGNAHCVGGVQTNPNDDMQPLDWGSIDPRTTRFSTTFGCWLTESLDRPANSTLLSSDASHNGLTTGEVPYYGNFVTPVSGANYAAIIQNWLSNTVTLPPGAVPSYDNPTTRPITTPASFPQPNNTPAYYADLDGVVRPADGAYVNASTGDGIMLFTVPGSGSTAYGDTTGTGTYAGNTQHGRRPVILNRPFRSVGELGYVFRDMPFKTLDMFSQSSADAALLDVFSLTDESKVDPNTQQITSVAAGQFNPSNAPAPVIQAVLAGGSKKDLDSSYNLGTEAANLATAIVNTLNPTSGPRPLLNRANLATQLEPTLQPIFSNVADKSNKAYLEAPVRALADVTNTRTWNLLIDVIAQSGQMSATAQSLNDFVVQGERRYWLHIAIDRYTGKVVAQQLEPVYE